VSQGFGYAPTPARQALQAPAPPPHQADQATAGRGGAAAGRGGAPQPYPGSYPESLVKDVIPFIDKRFRTLATKEDRGIAGLSMGGGHTLAATNNNPGTFAYIGVFSSGPQAVDETFQKQLEGVKAGGVKFYWLGAGTTDTARDRTVTLSELVKKDGFNTTYREIPGRHYWFLWRDFLVHYAQISFVPAAKS
jgi:enterochelin esterase-like enzyme